MEERGRERYFDQVPCTAWFKSLPNQSAPTGDRCILAIEIAPDFREINVKLPAKNSDTVVEAEDLAEEVAPRPFSW